MAIPTKPIEPIRDRVPVSSFHCRASAAITNEISPTSIASSAQPMPEATTSLVCRRVNGSRSKRSERVSEVSVTGPQPLLVLLANKLPQFSG